MPTNTRRKRKTKAIVYVLLIVLPLAWRVKGLLVAPERVNSKHGQDALMQAIQSWQHCPTMNSAVRIFHGRGGCFPGFEHLTMDWYPPVFLLTSFGRRPSEEDTRMYQCALEEKLLCGSSDNKSSSINLVHQHRDGTGAASTQLVAGQVPDPHIVTENGCQYLVQLLTRGQNHGLFLDMAAGRQWVQQHARGANVLNLFAYTCAFSVAALRGRAAQVTNVDMSKTALQIGQRNHEFNGHGKDGKVRFLRHDVFKSWSKLRRLGPYSMIVVDPPTFQKGSFVARTDYVKVIGRLSTFMAPAAYVLLCLNAPELDEAFLHDAVQQAAPQLEFIQRLDNLKSFPALDRNRALKVVVYQMPRGMQEMEERQG